ncbi:HAD-IC family P-type ATPase [Atopobium fossor]|uniref:HAD-IC family P-type ATPase n=1 Tax=Atopobium fossor TaxID=39487 RepID=UPI00040829D7|nr:HAD-IC family P-type ATPase [Atopobium fossor]
MKKQTNKSELTPKDIVINNVFTYFNAIFAVIAVLLIFAGSYRSLTFLPVVIANALIGIVQQLRARSVLNKLSLLSRSSYVVLRDGQQLSLASEELLAGDIITLEAGQQIPADAIVMDGLIAANESLLTGEADEIEKLAQAQLLSGSFVVSGSCTALLTHVGEDCYAARLQAKAKEVREKPSEMIHDINLIVRIAGIVIIPLGCMLFYQAFYVNGYVFKASVESMVGAIIGMIPEGLYLLVTVALALSALRLAQNKVLLHDMRSTETLARIDVLCVDKTGTITNNNMQVVELFDPTGVAVKKDNCASCNLLARYAATVPDANATMEAIRACLEQISSATPTSAFNVNNVLPFSSKNKYSQVDLMDGGSLRFGAPEFVLDASILGICKDALTQRTARGQRVLVFAQADTTGVFKPLLFVSLVNGLRPNVSETFTWFGQQEVRVMVISGDNPQTVSKIAAQVEIPHADQYVNASELSDEDFATAVTKYTVFGRVKPEQKKQIVEALKAQDLRVAMTGDGVNDILAMKEADCSIAMGTGSDAARQAAQVVILDDDFSHMKQIISEGRRDINNLLRSATLFLYKNIFSMLLATCAILFAWVYPLKPSQVSLVSMFNIGVPAFLLAMEQNNKKQHGRFIYEALIRAIPAALTSFCAIAALVALAPVLKISETDVGVGSTFLLSIAGFMVLFELSRPFNLWHACIFVGCVAGFIGTAFFLSDLFAITPISFDATLLTGAIAVIEILLMLCLNLFGIFAHKHLSFLQQ